MKIKFFYIIKIAQYQISTNTSVFVIELYLYNEIGIFMENRTTLEKLSDKVSQILQQYHSLKGESEVLRNELVTLKAESEMKSQEIEKLIEDNTMKDLEIEEIVNKIESILG